MMNEILIGNLILTWIVLGLLCFAMSGLMRTIQALSATGGSNPIIVGMPLPRIRKLSAALDQVVGAKLLVIADTGCSACRDFVADMGEGLSREHATNLIIVATHQDRLIAERPYGSRGIVAPDATEMLRINASPFYILLDDESRVHDYGLGLHAREVVRSYLELTEVVRSYHEPTTESDAYPPVAAESRIGVSEANEGTTSTEARRGAES